MERIRTLIVDDEPLALDLLRIECGRIPYAEVVGSATDSAAAIALIADLRPDLVILDIQMPGEGGLSVPRARLDPRPLFVFVTAHADFAVEAFDLEATDYLVKPLQPERLARTFDRARRKLLTPASPAPASMPTASPDAIWVSGREGYVRLEPTDIDWVEADRDYVLIHANGRSHILRATLTDITARLNPALFLRVRRSALVRITAIRGIRPAPRGLLDITLPDRTVVRVGPTYVDRVSQALGLDRRGL